MHASESSLVCSAERTGLFPGNEYIGVHDDNKQILHAPAAEAISSERIGTPVSLGSRAGSVVKYYYDPTHTPPINRQKLQRLNTIR